MGGTKRSALARSRTPTTTVAGAWAQPGAGGGGLGASPGEQVAQSGSQFLFATVPPEPAVYRVEVTTDWPGPAPLPTHTELVWTLRSQLDDAGRPTVSLRCGRFGPTRGWAGTTPPPPDG